MRFHGAFADTLEAEVARGLDAAPAKMRADIDVSDFDSATERKDNHAPD